MVPRVIYRLISQRAVLGLAVGAALTAGAAAVVLPLLLWPWLVQPAKAQFPGYPPVNSVQIGHGSASPPGWDFVLGTMASQDASNVTITGGAISGMLDPTTPQAVATKNYVDHTAVGINPHASVRLATVVALPNNTYANGTAGVGATLTATTNAALSIDGVAVAVNDRVLIKNETAAANNGIYVVTNAGAVGAAYVLTRATDANTIGNGPTLINAGAYVFVSAGTTLVNTAWVLNSTVATIGTSPMTWALFAAGAVASINGISGPLSIVGGSGITVTTATPNITVAANVLPNYLGGLRLSRDATTPATVLDIAAGGAADSTNTAMTIAPAFTKRTGGAWVAGSGNAGMGSGLVVTASTWYHVCLANNNGVADYWFDTAFNCTHRPAAITDTKFRRVGSFKTDTSSQIRPFTQSGNLFFFNQTQIFNFSFVNASGIITLDLPIGLVLTPITGGYFAVIVPSGFQAGASLNLVAGDSISVSAYPAAVYAIANGGSGAGSQGFSGSLAQPTNTLAQIGYNLTVSGTATSFTGQVYLQGYIDPRGQ